MSDYDVIVVGGGPMGLASAYNCAKAGRSVLVLERFNYFNQSGSSNDLVRMFRTMYTEDFMADLAYKSMGVWRELEKDAGQELIWMSGLLNFGDPNYQSGPEGNLMAPIKNMERLGLPYEVLSADQIMRRYPFKGLPNTFQGIFAPDNGCIDILLFLRTLYRLAQSYGAKLLSHSKVMDMKVAESGVTIVFDNGEPVTVTADKCIITCGAYTNDVVNKIGINMKLEIWEMVYGYYATDPGPNGTLFPSMWFQFLDPTDSDPALSNLFYGFPTVPWGLPNLARIAVDNAVNVITDPTERKITPAANDLRITADFVGKHCIGVDSRPNYCGTCLQTNVSDNGYVLDFLPPSVGAGHENIALFTAGWGMKLAPLIGKILSQLVLDGTTPYDISHFKITRPCILSKGQ
uniref:Sarcosine oxidase, monomeric form n=1 Tax=Candidatus Kentrum sp. LPFa TaxID=2126335 RepID=A0A450XZC7_9GAMM|nr:MAG: sarcosine oxidase, monomeric form [Candidatus Kentron sp. LPFa]VFK34658.1 MAG: sarcosine oxidase, monomeric form [Candidatus Kentron sp. LPFa]